jgi:hypothetical protein
LLQCAWECDWWFNRTENLAERWEKEGRESKGSTGEAGEEQRTTMKQSVYLGTCRGHSIDERYGKEGAFVVIATEKPAEKEVDK